MKKEVVYQKTFWDSDPSKVDELANKFKERDDVILVNTQINVAGHSNNIWFYTAILYKKGKKV